MDNLEAIIRENDVRMLLSAMRLGEAVAFLQDPEASKEEKLKIEEEIKSQDISALMDSAFFGLALPLP